jgi:acetolactate synthase-1/2/3 large subunit
VASRRRANGGAGTDGAARHVPQSDREKVSMTTTPSTTAEVISGFLKAAGVRHLYAYPGDSNIELMERARQAGVEPVLASREGTATFMAEGSAMATGVVGVCTSTLGPGSTALVNGLAAATLDRVPVLAISGQIDAAREPYFTHQVVDHTAVFSPVVKWAGRIHPGSAATVMRKVLRTATAERPGAVHLTVNSDVAAAVATDAEVALPPTELTAVPMQVFRQPGGPDPVRLLNDAQRPVVLAGIGAVRQGAGPAILALAEQCQMPVILGAMAKGVVPEDHPLFAGVLEMAGASVVYDLLFQADLVLAVGFDAVELFPTWTVKAPVVHVDTTPNTDQVYAAVAEVVGSIPGAMEWLSSEAKQRETWRPAEVQSHRDALRARYYSGRVQGSLNPSDALDVIRDRSPRDSIMVTDVGSHKILVGQGWTSYAPRTCLMSNGLSSMGFGLPAAIGAKLALPDSPVVAVVGDGGFAMVQSELRLAASLGLGIVVVVFSDESLNRIELKQKKLGYPSTATRIARVDLAAIAEAMGCHGVRTESAADLERAMDQLEGLDRPLVIEAVIDPTQYQFQS